MLIYRFYNINYDGMKQLIDGWLLVVGCGYNMEIYGDTQGA